MASLTIDRVARVQEHVVDTVIKTSDRSTLPAGEQDVLLAQSCAEACDLLADWLDDHDWWRQVRPDDGLLADVVPGPEQFTRFLGPMLTDALDRAGRHGMHIDLANLEEARRNLAATAHRNRGMTRRQLFGEAERRVGLLRDEVCGLARQLKDQVRDADSPSQAGAATRRRARGVLEKVRRVLPAVALTLAGAMLGAGPHQMAQSIAEWGHEAAKVVTVHQIAHAAQPGTRISPPRAGPRLH